MKGGARFYFAGAGMLLALAGCGRSFLQYGERASWRHEAEVECLKSGAVKIGAGVVQIQPIEGPGMCGADFPLKVAALGESPAMAYSDDMQPPGEVRDPYPAQMPRWPVNDQRYAPPPYGQPMQGERLRWVPGPPPAGSSQGGALAGRPVSISPPGIAPPDDIPDDAITPPGRAAPPFPRTQPAYNAPAYQPPSRAEPAYPRTQPAYNAPTYQRPSVMAPADDVPDDAVLPPGRAAYPRTQPAYNTPAYEPPQRALPPLGPMRGPNSTAAIMPTAVTPPATLACPLVSALDRWVSDGVQPAALHWFGTPVTEIKQISAYSCRGMVGSGSSHISEHAFGNALDIAGFTFADGRKIMVQDGWRGSPEEQGFLHDVQLYACETFTTVLAPGYNAAHYNHIHVDLMRRASGRRPCRPDAIPGEVVAAKVRAHYANRHGAPAYTGSVSGQSLGALLDASAGEDGYVADDDDDAPTGSIAAPAGKQKTGGVFDDAIARLLGRSPQPARQNAPIAEDRLTHAY
jgi:hypothetical protein